MLLTPGTFFSLTTTIAHLADMPKGIAVSDDLREAVLRMSNVFSYAEITAFTGVSKRQQQRIHRDWRMLGTAERPRPEVERRGRQRLVSAEEAFG